MQGVIVTTGTRERLNVTVMALKDRVRAARLSAGFSQSELARRIHVRPSAINHIESGRNTTVKAETLTRIAKACTVSVYWLDEGVGHMTPEARVTPEEAEVLSIFRGLNDGNRDTWLLVGHSLLDKQPRRPSSNNPFPTAPAKLKKV